MKNLGERPFGSFHKAVDHHLAPRFFQLQRAIIAQRLCHSRRSEENLAAQPDHGGVFDPGCQARVENTLDIRLYNQPGLELGSVGDFYCGFVSPNIDADDLLGETEFLAGARSCGGESFCRRIPTTQANAAEVAKAEQEYERSLAAQKKAPVQKIELF